LAVTLQRDPQNLLARWLLNIAYMQLGRWPQSTTLVTVPLRGNDSECNSG